MSHKIVIRLKNLVNASNLHPNLVSYFNNNKNLDQIQSLLHK
jgi:hypothetical protein